MASRQVFRFGPNSTKTRRAFLNTDPETFGLLAVLSTMSFFGGFTIGNKVAYEELRSVPQPVGLGKVKMVWESNLPVSDAEKANFPYTIEKNGEEVAAPSLFNTKQPLPQATEKVQEVSQFLSNEE